MDDADGHLSRMNALTVNPETGFLDADNWNSFTAEKKVKFLQLAEECVKTEGKWPDLGQLCTQMGIDPRTLDRHLKIDEKFKEMYEGITVRGKWSLESLMYNLSGKNPMYMFGWLRKHFPAEYNPDHKVTVDHNINVLQSLIHKAKDNNDIIDTQAL